MPHAAHPDSLPTAALVTGAARRIGRALALSLAEAGFAVAVHYNGSAEAAEEVVRLIGRGGGRAVALQADLAEEAQAARLLPAAVEALGPLGVLVNNASTFERDEWHDATRESWDHHLEPNLRAPFVLSQAFARQLPEDAGGLIVNLLDQRVWNLTPHFVSYTVSKAALWTLTRSLALALAPRIRVNGIGPGPALPSPRQSDAQFTRQAASTPLGRGTDPEEICRTLRFLLEARSMTGQMIALDGGQHLNWSPASGPPVEE
ncbi:NAD(P)-dependent dehydrogenase, short-chain alcohol dehydrogenase family [Tistlia consotensis]|uniref:NAD(P)-dependent dehydrogenase, short-chain alcohol dehydrogenase family n=1 Tax=Tistlia consotensis USBA 355 TaxID=560819 RepID=A0A1Y6CGP1_9PROT|nr:SDR family oxidoreductase [Tistlia consotensis]SMF60952.1 NAD(P)-dependent dehydrogenase, short-chain alcohol dehydrogenase family [Tistlia consotensis USBA 355]SNR92360.1 NAD(P)-dependent dehydrogenase, short-chain alcohol dehydrogenase family [Tistlia consotensis]